MADAELAIDTYKKAPLENKTQNATARFHVSILLRTNDLEKKQALETLKNKFVEKFEAERLEWNTKKSKLEDTKQALELIAFSESATEE